MLPYPMLMRYTCDQLMTADWYMTINSDINLQELSDQTSIVDSSGKLQCHYNYSRFYSKASIYTYEVPKPISVVQKKVTFTDRKKA